MNAQSYRRYIEIWERHREEIWRFIQSRLRNSSEQEDILQEVFLALYQKLDSGEEIQNAAPGFTKPLIINAAAKSTIFRA